MSCHAACLEHTSQVDDDDSEVESLQDSFKQYEPLTSTPDLLRIIMVSLVGAVHQFKIMMPVMRKTPRNSRAHFSTLSWVIGGNDIEITDYFKSYYGLFQRVCSCNEYFPTVK